MEETEKSLLVFILKRCQKKFCLVTQHSRSHVPVPLGKAFYYKMHLKLVISDSNINYICVFLCVFGSVRYG